MYETLLCTHIRNMMGDVSNNEDRDRDCRIREISREGPYFISPGDVNYQCPGAYPRMIPPNPPCPAAMLPDGPAIRAGAAIGPARAAGPTAGPASTAP